MLDYANSIFVVESNFLALHLSLLPRLVHWSLQCMSPLMIQVLQSLPLLLWPGAKFLRGPGL